MLKFEEIILNQDSKENRNIYRSLSEDIHSENKKIVCYVGAGLSLYCKRWDKLFERVYNDISQDVKKENGLDVSWKEYKNKREKVDYLQIADEIDDILKKSTPKSSFNKAVQSYITNQINGKKQLSLNAEVINCISIGTSKEKTKIPADIVYYLPYLMPGIPKRDEKKQTHKCRILTTNIDDSVLDAFAYYDLKILQLHAINQMDTIDMNQDQHIVFYIHGYYSHLESYVMTGRDYKKVYGNKKNKRILKKYAYDSEAVWFFLGAGLENDRPLDTLKSCFGSVNDKGHQLRNFAFLDEKRENIEEKREKVEKGYFANAFFIPKDSFDCYSIFFCQLIREAKGDYWNTFVCGESEPHSLYTSNVWIDDKDIKEMLENSKVFDCMNHSIDQSLKQKLKDYLFDDYVRNYKWAVCWIDSEDFEFSTEKFNPLSYHWPLGNTIYLLHGISCRKKEHCITLLKDWCERSHDVFKNGIKVRVFYQPVKEYFFDKLSALREPLNGDDSLYDLLMYILEKLNEPVEINDKSFIEFEDMLAFLDGKFDNYTRRLYEQVLTKINEQLNHLYSLAREETQKEEYTQYRDQHEGAITNNEQLTNNMLNLTRGK